MTKTSYNWPFERSTTRVIGLHGLDKVAALKAQMATLAKTVSKLIVSGNQQSIASMAATNACSTLEDLEVQQVNYVHRGQGQQGHHSLNSQNLASHYHPGCRFHENFSYANPRNALHPPSDFGQ